MNRLANESSPYLLQHAKNPVEWYPWGEEALEKAKKEDKLLIISIGYSACHWCHVMEKECFENHKIAAFMNEHFICIKVDREERPDLDQVYMTAIQLLNGSGGWPLNCFALPDGMPFYGGTYFPHTTWMQILQNIVHSWHNERERIIQATQSLKENMLSWDIFKEPVEGKVFANDDLDLLFQNIRKHFDLNEGGTMHTPKFPMPNYLTFLLKYWYYTKNQLALDHVVLTCTKMAYGGIFDQIGGGFSRYSVDSFWHVPHFEKMLYDNAQLLGLYSELYQITKHSLFKEVAENTILFIQRELTHSSGMFYSALDADSEGKEGKYYVWTKSEIDEALGDLSKFFCEYYAITEQGNWEEGQNILYIKVHEQYIIEKYSISAETIKDKIRNLKKILYEKRNNRIKPDLDNKLITSWNSMMIKSLVLAYNAFQNEDYLKMAITCGNKMMSERIKDDGQVFRIYNNEIKNINAFLDDYAFTIEAFIQLYSITLDKKWILTAKKMCDYCLQHFNKPNSALFYYTSDLDPVVVVRKTETHDSVMPSSNSVMATNLFTLGKIFFNEDFISRAEQMLNEVLPELYDQTLHLANWASLMFWFVYPPYELTILGENAPNYIREIQQIFRSDYIYAGCIEYSEIPLLTGKFIDGKTVFYKCQAKVCLVAAESFEEFKPIYQQINGIENKKG